MQSRTMKKSLKKSASRHNFLLMTSMNVCIARDQWQKYSGDGCLCARKKYSELILVKIWNVVVLGHCLRAVTCECDACPIDAGRRVSSVPLDIVPGSCPCRVQIAYSILCTYHFQIQQMLDAACQIGNPQALSKSCRGGQTMCNILARRGMTCK